ncbi:MAG TPA: helix-turn-helix transcriptional regulator [Chloroflexi bacterium]|nr:MAG: transcriptional regulator [Chloroflexota bacterium]HHW88946.1 helix-turn-helix transcriptional regulator [Chloroflexota bacterium]
MQRNAFGQIVASLRKERLDPLTGRPWTQEQLAAASRLSLRVIANLEQGKKATLDGAVLEGLATALQLTTLERREFFTMAIDLNDESPVTPVFDAHAADAELLELFACLHQPAFLYDDYFDILAANHAALTLHAIESVWLQSLAGEGERPNFLHVIFAPDSPMRRSMQAGWRMLALRNLHQFRAMTLRHRHTTRWHTLMAQLRMLPDFSAYWDDTHFDQADVYSHLRQHHYVHSRVGELRYAVMANTVYRPVVHRHLTALLPLDEHTFGVFAALREKSGGGFLKWLIQTPEPIQGDRLR